MLEMTFMVKCNAEATVAFHMYVVHKRGLQTLLSCYRKRRAFMRIAGTLLQVKGLFFHCHSAQGACISFSPVFSCSVAH